MNKSSKSTPLKRAELTTVASKVYVAMEDMLDGINARIPTDEAIKSAHQHAIYNFTSVGCDEREGFIINNAGLVKRCNTYQEAKKTLGLL